MKMERAIFKKQGKTKEILARDISRYEYNKEYKNYLFCTEKGCNAKVGLVQRKNETKYFRTFPSTSHKYKCPNEVTYSDEDEIIGYESVGQDINISNEHIRAVLDRAYGKMNKNNASGIKTTAAKGTKENKDFAQNIGRPSLLDEGKERQYGKEPYIVTRQYNEIISDDNNKVRCVIGNVDTIQIFEKHAYINLTPKITDSVKIHFAEYFVAHNKSQFERFNIINEYISMLKNDKKKIVCCCVGQIRYVKSGINILLDRYNAFTLNGLGFYEIIDYMSK